MAARVNDPSCRQCSAPPPFFPRVCHGGQAGKRMVRAVLNPWNWRHLRKPALPSWGEPYADVVGRMNAAMTQAWEAADAGDNVPDDGAILATGKRVVVFGGGDTVSDCIGTSHRQGAKSVTSFEMVDGKWTETAYAEPASTAGAVDVGAV